MNTDSRVRLDDLIACPGCDLLHHRQPLVPGHLARCARCASVLATCKPRTIERTLAAASAGIVLLVLSLTLPFLSLSRSGIESRISVLDAVGSLWRSELLWLGLLTLAMIAVLPLARLGLLVWVLLRLQLGLAVLPSMRKAYRWAVRLEPWAMADVFVVGVTVSLVKLGSIARLDIGLAFWALCGLVAMTVIVGLVQCHDTIWARLAA